MTEAAIPPANLRLRLDGGALVENWRALDRMSGGAQTGAAVKADAYGLGVDQVVPLLAHAGARQYFLAHWGEVPAVLPHIPAHMVSVLHGVQNAQEVAFARSTGVRPVINSLRQARLWLEGGGGPCQLMIDSGINRLGLEPSNCADPILQDLQIELLMSHLASADEDSAQNAEQLAVFKKYSTHFPETLRSLSNSAGIALGNDYHFDVTRPGIALYGGIVRKELDGLIKQVAFPEAQIMQIRQLSKGEGVGYNAQWRAQEDMRVGVVSMGYADGILRCWGSQNLQNGEGPNLPAFVFQGTELPILGRVSMDMIGVDCSAAPEICEGDFIELAYHLPTAAAATNLSQYELLTALGSRFMR